MSLDLEMLRDMFKDNREHIAIGLIKQLAPADDRSMLQVMVAIFPDGREIVARMTWEMTGPESGCIEFPAVNDLVMVAFAEGEAEQAFVIRRLTSKEDKLPLRAIDGHMVLKSKSGKQIWITSNNKILLSTGDTLPTENLVLGQELKTLLSAILTQLSSLSLKISTHTHIGNFGFPTQAPLESADFVTIKTALDNLKSSPVDDAGILSNVAFTEKG